MCFSYEISISTFFFSWAVSIYLLTKNLNKMAQHNVIFLMIFSSMQLIDAIFWKIDMKKNNINYYLTSYIVPLILSAQIIYSIYFINDNVPLLIQFAAIIAIILLFKSYNSTYTIPSDNIFSSPLWGGAPPSRINMIIFFLLILYGRLGLSGHNLINLLGGIVSLFVSFLISGGVGSIWCSFANIFSIVYLVWYG